jgi:hypothetical protein
LKKEPEGDSLELFISGWAKSCLRRYDDYLILG